MKNKFGKAVKQRYGKIVSINQETNEVIIDGEINAMHRGFNLNYDPTQDTSPSAYYGLFVFNGGEFGDVLITDSQDLSAHAEGIQTIATVGAHSEGYKSKANEFASHAEGAGTTTSGWASHAEGAATIASGHQAHAEGELTQAIGYASHTEGGSSQATGHYGHAEGFDSQAIGRISHAEGNHGKAEGNYSHAEGNNTKTSGMASHAEGANTTVISTYGHVEGYNNIVGLAEPDGSTNIDITINPSAGKNGVIARFYYINLEDGNEYIDIPISEGESTCTFEMNGGYKEIDPYANGIEIYDEVGATPLHEYSVSFQVTPGIIIRGVASHAEGQDNKTFGNFSHAEGRGNEVTGTSAHVEGQANKSIGINAHAEGYKTQAIGDGSHSEGNSAKSIGNYSHAEGYETKTYGLYSHTEGWKTSTGEENGELAGQCGHAEGYLTKALGRFSHAQGRETEANGVASFSSGIGTQAKGNYQTVIGKYNRIDANKAFIIGKGNSNTDRTNAMTVDWSGNAYFNGKIYIGNASAPGKELATVEYVNTKAGNGGTYSSWSEEEKTKLITDVLNSLPNGDEVSY